MNSKSETIGYGRKRKAAVTASRKKSIELDMAYRGMLEEEEEDDPAEVSSIEETDDDGDDEDTASAPPPKTLNLEETDNEDNMSQRAMSKKAAKRISALLGANAEEVNQGKLDFSMDSGESKSIGDRWSPVIKLGGSFSMMETVAPYATKLVTIRRRCLKASNGEYSNNSINVPYSKLPSLALASLHYCSIIPEISTIINNDHNFIPRFKAIQKELLTISGK